MNFGTIGQALVAFVATNIDDFVVLIVFFGQAPGHRSTAIRIIAGQYLGFIAIVAVSVATAIVGSLLLPGWALRYFGLIPILVGVRFAVRAWRARADEHAPAGNERRQAPGVWQVAAVTFSNGGDNYGVYVPIFAVHSAATVTLFIVVFLVCLGFWCLAARYVVAHPVVARTMTRWGHIVLPVVLIAIGLSILLQGHLL